MDVKIADDGLMSENGESPTMEVRVDVGKKTVVWRTARPIRFSDITHRVARDAYMFQSSLNTKVWRCAGCGRKVLKEEEMYQEIPANCCRVRSLHLIEKKRRVMRDVETETEAKIQIPHKRQQPDIEACPLYIEYKGGNNIILDPLILGAIFVGAIRRAVGHQMGMDPRRVSLERRICFNKFGNICVEVCDENGKLAHQRWFGDKDGNVFSASEVYNIYSHALTIDTAAFLNVPGRRCVLKVQRCLLAEPRLLYVLNVDDPDFTLSPLLPDPVTVGTIREEVAKELKVHIGRVKMERRIATGPDGVKCFKVGKEWGYADKKGNLYDDVEEARKVELYNDDDRFETISGIRSLIKVSLQEEDVPRRRFYIRNSSGMDRRIAPRLPRTFEVSELRWMVAEKLGVDPDRITMWRWQGVCDSRKYYHVCNDDVMFADAEKDRAMFEGELGLHRRDELQKVKRLKLKDKENLYFGDFWHNLIIYVKID